jgi:hypothetical protein
MSLQLPGDLHIFHQGNIRIAPDSQEEITPHKNTLIASGNCAKTGAPVHHEFNNPQHGMFPRKPDIESPPLVSLLKGLHHRLKVSSRQSAVCMEKPEQLSPGRLSPGIHLASSARPRSNQSINQRPGHITTGIAAPAIGNDHLMPLVTQEL